MTEPPTTTTTAAAAAPAEAAKPKSWVPRRSWRPSLSRVLGGPVFAKEVWVLGKRLSTSWVRFIYGFLLLGMLAIVVVNATDSYSYSGNMGNLQALQAYQQIAPVVTIAVLGFQFGMLPLMGCVLGGSAVCEEVRAGSLATLLSTPLKAWQIVMGKLLGRCTELLILSLLALPVLLMARVLGGVNGESLIAPTVLCAANALLALQISIWTSARAKHAAGAIAGAIGVLFVLWVLPSVLVGVLMSVPTMPFKGLNPLFITLLSPPIVFLVKLGDIASWGAPPFQTLHWVWSVVSSLALTGLFFVLSTRAVRRAMVATALLGPGAGRTTKKAPPDKRRAVSISQDVPMAATPALDGASPDAPLDSSPDSPQETKEAARQRKRKKSAVVEGYSRTVGDNPVLWREVQQRFTRGQWALPVALGICCCALLFLYWMSSMKEGLQIGVAMFGAVILLLLAALQTPGAISSEREGRTLDVLLTTPLSARAILWGKLLGSAKRLAPLYVAIALHLFFSGVLPGITRYIFLPLDEVVRFLRFASPAFARNSDFIPEHIDGYRSYLGWAPARVDPVAILAFLLVLACTVFMQFAVGLLLSAVMRRTTPATICNLLLWILVWAFLPVVLAIVDNGLIDLYGALHPVVLMAMVLDGGTDNAALSATYDVPDNNVQAFTFFVFLVLYCFAATGVGLGALKVASLELGFAGGRKR
jgi:ABC-type transport system involved in multi-copper enzyme maturation permease subunit